MHRLLAELILSLLLLGQEETTMEGRHAGDNLPTSQKQEGEVWHPGPFTGCLLDDVTNKTPVWSLGHIPAPPPHPTHTHTPFILTNQKL